MVPSDRKVTHNVKRYATRESWRRVTLCKGARDNSLQEGEVADRGAMEAGSFPESGLETLFIATMSCPENSVYVPKESSFPIPSKYIDFVRETKTNNLDNLEESSNSESWSRSQRFRIMNKRPLQGYSQVDGRCAHNTRHTETRNDSARSAIIQMCSMESKAAMGY